MGKRKCHRSSHTLKPQLCISEPEEWEDFDGDDDVVDLRAYQVLGGTFHFNLLNLPPQPKQVNDWVITQGMFRFISNGP